MEIERLENKINGRGEVSGYTFEKVKESWFGYIYRKTGDGKRFSYEVFKRNVVAKCIDFKKRIYSETEFKETYPKTRDFGKWAFEHMDITSAERRLEEFKHT